VTSVSVRARDDDLHVAAELRRELYTVEILAVRTLVERTDIEEDDEDDKQTDRHRQARYHADDLAPPAQVRDVRPRGKRQ